ncbi:hypothetical protein PCANC_16281 [Puccinia coronata f. sp. avenae]|uniref:SGNH hydrolase-type esterase domain-containing protein n=1 Tax=Puccinia coronata f. sp. avenae TaxID=200324 RepID=A0A2N5U7S0_9BASI|nr:hypothetical protein PCANC_16281 [Puccinia coronata f. sp. avenae]
MCSRLFGLLGFVVLLFYISNEASGMEERFTDSSDEYPESLQPSNEFLDSFEPSSEPPDLLPLFSNQVPRSFQAQPSMSKYSAFVVFGDSYSDNGHARAPQHNDSFAAKPAVGGRFCDGPVWNEYLVQKLANSEQSNITFLNYAYNGAHINNTLSNSFPNPVPDTGEQIQTYLTELENYVKHPTSAKGLAGNILHTIWIGINPILSIWRSTSYGNETLHPGTFLTPELVEKVDKQVAELNKQLLLLLNNASVSEFQSDFLIMTIPPLTFTNLAVTQAAQQAKGDVTLARKYITLLGELTDDYNQKLVSSIQSIRRQQSMYRGVQNFLHRKKRGCRVTLFDTVKFWNDVKSEPQKFGIQSLGSCYTNTQKPPCKQPDHFMYWDILHPSSILHDDLSTAVKTVIDGLDQ